jgi:RHS repeat-associated protein
MATGLVYLRARYYAPWDGRFLSSDPWSGDYYQPISYNDWLYTYANPINLIDPSGKFPEWCKSSKSRLDYENCVRKHYHLLAPRDFEIYPQRIALSPARNYAYGLPGCWEGPVAYAAPGYIEGISASVQTLLGYGRGFEIVYDFASMERQVFTFEYINFGDQLGASASEYAGIAWGFDNVESVAKNYSGEYWFLSLGVSTDFPGQPVQLGTGATHFASTNYRIWGFAWYFSIGATIDPIPVGDIEIGFGKSVTTHLAPTTYSDTRRVINPSQLRDDITLGRGSPLIVPLPNVLARGLGIEFATYWSWIYEEIHSKSSL